MYTKTQRPDKHTSDENSSIINFFYEFAQLKNLYRQGWVREGLAKEQTESVADHILGVVMLSYMIAQKHFPNLDINKVIKLALLHDISEVFAGDITPYDGITKEQKHQMELKAVKKLFRDFTNADNYVKIWEEYEAKQTPEAIFVNQIDKLETALQAGLYEAQHNLDGAQWFETSGKVIKDEVLRQIYEEALELKNNLN